MCRGKLDMIPVTLILSTSSLLGIWDASYNLKDEKAHGSTHSGHGNFQRTQKISTPMLVQYGYPQNRPSCWRSITTNVKVSCAMATADAICGCHERLHRNVTDAEQKMGFIGILLPTGRYGFDILKTIFLEKMFPMVTFGVLCLCSISVLSTAEMI